MVELQVDTQARGACAERREGSNPSDGTMHEDVRRGPRQRTGASEVQVSLVYHIDMSISPLVPNTDAESLGIEERTARAAYFIAERAHENVLDGVRFELIPPVLVYTQGPLGDILIAGSEPERKFISDKALRSMAVGRGAVLEISLDLGMKLGRQCRALVYFDLPARELVRRAAEIALASEVLSD